MDDLLRNSTPLLDNVTIITKEAAPTKVESSLSEHLFERFSELIYTHSGINLNIDKKIMLEGRLQKRMRTLGITFFRKYYEYTVSNTGVKDELSHLLDAVTTNKTDFFREPAHFSFLSEIALPELSAKIARGADRELKIWSAGCSSGEEPYTLGMLMFEHAQQSMGFKFSILATDICTQVLETAKRGIYSKERIEPIPLHLRKKYILRSKDSSKNLFRMAPLLRRCIKFQRLNFMDDDFGISETMDVIFCRNVLIYFDKQTQERLLRKFCSYLSPGGFVFIGHSETLSGMDVPLVQVATTIYRKRP